LSPNPSDPQASSHRQSLAALSLGALGVVYGDIGTSPLYTIKELFAPGHGVALNPIDVIGAISTIVWLLIFVVSFKYALIVLRAGNQGEGGALALTALASSATDKMPRLKALVLTLGLFGATLFYGDSLITPAISVLGAVEGLEIITPALKPAVIPVTLVILGGLFALQRQGTKVVGRLFGPVVLLWFLLLGVSGIWHIVQYPDIVQALNPLHAAAFIGRQGGHLLLPLGAIVLAVTGAEALYADMGHFGPKPIRWAWSFVVLPALALNYMGQGALLLQSPEAVNNPFYNLFSSQLLWPVLGLATFAAIIASQAVISGAFSMTRQAVQLGFLPRMRCLHTSAAESGQIYMPAVNAMLFVGVVAAVLIFKSSSALAGAYGIAVTLTMVITTLLIIVVALLIWRLPLLWVVPVGLLFLIVDGSLFASCAVKLFEGGIFPLVLGLLLFSLMSTWRRGRSLVMQALGAEGIPLEDFVKDLDVTSVPHANRIAVYAVADSRFVPQALLHNLKHNQVLHRRNLIVSVRFATAPWVPEQERTVIEQIGQEFWRITFTYGFMEVPDMPRALAACQRFGLSVPLFETSYFLSRETIVSVPGGGMMHWRELLFAAMNRNASGVVEFFCLPDNAVVELGTRLQI
jgi:KUP system potassium uptake protein